jgi:TetR/AcrR family fatty acid metabolism transcriptional regulator
MILFSNKNEILDYIFEVEFSKRIRLLNELKKKKISLKEKIAIFLDRHFEDLQQNLAKAIVIVQESRAPIKHRPEAIEIFMEKIPLILKEMIDKAIEQEEIRKVNSRLVADTIFYSIREMAFNVANGSQYDFLQIKKELLNLFWIGLKR